MKIGLFFGTFNPVHNGHVKIVSSIMEQKFVDQVWIILTPLSPFKKNQNIISFYHRMQMLEKAFNNNKHVLISDVENNLNKPNYTINTLCHLTSIYPKNEFSIILGADNFQYISLWKDYKTILKNYPFFIYPRKGIKLEGIDFCSMSLKIKKLSMEVIPISSSLIRSDIMNQAHNNYLNPSVYKYIITNKLY